ncbi:antitoxin [Actinokineospora auranticolor]|uniref:Ribbon-helix-helix CopG family protein n=1 Tax=Actinokineospora auranticolor TaxID=155976 RepID=A0A2S6GNG5_9PSEU|nr:antitoxin [Actinokineospora auranticolor]PPK66768.1 hypothetical protein CLV40_109153 [Actinokineospora auranticolor]
MKLSVSLPEEDVRFIDEYLGRAAEHGNRSAVIQLAIGLLRESSLRDEYLAAFDEWDAGEDALLWEPTAADGALDAAR